MENLDFEDISTEKVVSERERQIVHVILKDQLQDEIRHLFDIMDGIPGNRRLPIMPGVTLEDKKGPSRKVTAKYFSGTFVLYFLLFVFRRAPLNPLLSHAQLLTRSFRRNWLNEVWSCWTKISWMEHLNALFIHFHRFFALF